MIISERHRSATAAATEAAASHPSQQNPERLPWLQAMNGLAWERLVRIPPRRAMGLPHGWGPNGVRAAYIRRFGKPPHRDRGRYIYSAAELLAVAELLKTEAAAWGAGR